MKPHLRRAASSQSHLVLASALGAVGSSASTRRDVSFVSRQPRSGSGCILLVNADLVALEQIGSCLSNKGHEVVAVPTFQAAKEVFRAISPDLVVADVRLEAFNGLHLAAWIRFEPTLPKSPVIITHFEPEPVLEVEALRLGADFIVDPLHNPDFLPHVRAALAESNRAQPSFGRG